MTTKRSVLLACLAVLFSVALINCGAYVDIGGDCVYDEDCGPGAICDVDGVCVEALGTGDCVIDGCPDPTDICDPDSGFCYITGGAVCSDINEPCDFDSDCCDDFCDVDGFCS